MDLWAINPIRSNYRVLTVNLVTSKNKLDHKKINTEYEIRWLLIRGLDYQRNRNSTAEIWRYIHLSAKNSISNTKELVVSTSTLAVFQLWKWEWKVLDAIFVIWVLGPWESYPAKRDCSIIQKQTTEHPVSTVESHLCHIHTRQYISFSATTWYVSSVRRPAKADAWKK